MCLRFVGVLFNVRLSSEIRADCLRQSLLGVLLVSLKYMGLIHKFVEVPFDANGAFIEKTLLPVRKTKFPQGGLFWILELPGLANDIMGQASPDRLGLREPKGFYFQTLGAKIHSKHGIEN